MSDSALTTEGFLHAKHGYPDLAMAAYKKAIAEDPANAKALVNIGILYRAAGQIEDALDCYERAIDADPQMAEAHNNLAVVLTAQKRYEEAAVEYSICRRLQPDSAQFCRNFAETLLALDRPEEANVECDRALYLDSADTDGGAWCNKGLAMMRLGYPEAAIPAFRESIGRNPVQYVAHKNLALALLSLGRYAEGWKEFEWRWASDNVTLRKYKKPFWKGEAVGKTLFWPEQGIGDEICYAAFARSLPAGSILECDPRLVTLFQRSFPDLWVCATGTTVEDQFDSHLPMGSLGNFFELPSRTHSIYADPDWAKQSVFRKWRKPRTKVIGVSWASQDSVNAAHKSTPLGAWADVLDLPAQFISLQYGKEVALDPFVFDRKNDFESLAAAIAACDYVVTVSNTVAHLAGALGVKTFVLVPASQGKLWYWGNEGEKVDWYPSVTAMRQARGEPWQVVLSRVAERLGPLCR